jgi:hypothetical protein
MPSKFTLITGAAFVGVLMYDNIKTKIQLRTAAELYIASHEAFEKTQTANEAQILYLCHMIDKNNVTADEFDLMALINFHQ